MLSVYTPARGLNGVRPRRPEQLVDRPRLRTQTPAVSMESGLEGRNNKNEISESLFSFIWMSQWSPA